MSHLRKSIFKIRERKECIFYEFGRQHTVRNHAIHATEDENVKSSLTTGVEFFFYGVSGEIICLIAAEIKRICECARMRTIVGE